MFAFVCTLRGTSMTVAEANLARKEYIPKVGVLMRMLLGPIKRMSTSNRSSDPARKTARREE